MNKTESVHSLNSAAAVFNTSTANNNINFNVQHIKSG